MNRQSRPVCLIRYDRDLRVEDHGPLRAALARGYVPVPVFVWENGEGGRAPGAASRRWLHTALIDLDTSLRALGSRLVVRTGDGVEEVVRLARETGATAVYWHRRYEPATRARDTRLKEALRADGIEAESFAGDVLVEPFAVKTGSSGPYRVFTPYWRAVEGRVAANPQPAPERLPAPPVWPTGVELAELGLSPRIPWDAGMAAAWEMTRAGGLTRLSRLTSGRSAIISGYEETRDLPAEERTSRLSPYLHFGQLSVAEVWSRVSGISGVGAATYRRELGWREFGRHLIYHFPDTPELEFNPAFLAFPWRADEALREAWRLGRTGVPLVDAGMRELWATGWMHNRVRMVVGSFLVKHLLQDWRAGERWFWDTLVDADLAQNTLGWQWVAGCGADAAPYFRVFNPVTQGEKFDPAGEYVRRWIPELREVPTKWIHRPWEAPTPPAGYPAPVVGLNTGRLRALDAYARSRASVKA